MAGCWSSSRSGVVEDEARVQCVRLRKSWFLWLCSSCGSPLGQLMAKRRHRSDKAPSLKGHPPQRIQHNLPTPNPTICAASPGTWDACGHTSSRGQRSCSKHSSQRRYLTRAGPSLWAHERVPPCYHNPRVCNTTFLATVSQVESASTPYGPYCCDCPESELEPPATDITK